MAKKAKSKKKSPAKKSIFRKSSTARMKTTDVYERERQRHQEMGGSSRFFRPAEGKTKMRLLPFIHDGEAAVFEPNFTHFNVPGDKKAVRCLGPDEECPICDLEGDVPSEVWSGTAGRGGIRPSRKFLANAVLRKSLDRKEDEQVIVELPWSAWDGISRAIEDGEIDNAFDAKKGVDFVVSRKKDKNFTKYEIAVVMKSKPVSISIEPKDLIEAAGKKLDKKAMAGIAEAIFETVAS